VVLPSPMQVVSRVVIPFVLQWCHSDDKMVLQGCNSGIKVSSHWCYSGVTFPDATGVTSGVTDLSK
jgi:hypothetical protein